MGYASSFVPANRATPDEVLIHTFPSASSRMELMNLLGKPSRSVYVVATAVIQPDETAIHGTDPQYSGATFVQREGHPSRRRNPEYSPSRKP